MSETVPKIKATEPILRMMLKYSSVFEVININSEVIALFDS